jgi:hypothetical protein
VLGSNDAALGARGLVRMATTEEAAAVIEAVNCRVQPAGRWALPPKAMAGDSKQQSSRYCRRTALLLRSAGGSIVAIEGSGDGVLVPERGRRHDMRRPRRSRCFQTGRSVALGATALC